MNANDLDNRLLAGDLDVDAAGTGVQAAARAKILSSPTLKASSDNPISGFLWFAYLDTKVAPLNNLHCRAGDRVRGQQDEPADRLRRPGGRRRDRQHGGPAERHRPEALRPVRRHHQARTATSPRPRRQLKLCGHPNGFTTGVTYRSDRPKEVAAATALQQALAQVGIKTALHGYPSGTYYSNFAGVPKFMDSHNIGVAFGGWAPDWPDGYGFFDFITAGDTISPAGNTNIEQLNDPVVNNDLNKMASTTNATQRNSYTAQIDMQVMKDAAILPEVYAKSLLYRSPNLTNVYVQPYYGMYNYAVLGLK